ncbi:MAG: Hsp20/alpha crystallin family protein [Paracoccaceae bacterium]|nr:Hsp20/alpha crystallin family protein [Paracoccaceae bacterium]
MSDTPTRLDVQRTTAPRPQQADSPGTFDMLRREVDRLFDDFLPARWRPGFAAFVPPGAGEWPLAPAAELSEQDHSFLITVELPGIDPAAVEVKLSDGTLLIKGEKTQEKTEENAERYICERRYGAFQRSFSVPQSVDTGKIEASFSNGVLTVTLPKSAAAKANEKRIAVKAA